MTFGGPWGTGFYGGGGSSPLVPGLFHFAIGGRTYMLDLSRDRGGIVNGDIATQRPQVDDSASPGEASLSTEGLWRRTVESFHHGGNQEFYDWGESDPFRFHRSAGVDPWTERALTLLATTDQVLTDAETVPLLAVASGRLYVTIGQEVRFTTDLAAWTAVTGGPSADAASLATDGQTVWVAYGASGIYQIAPGAAVMTSYVTGQVDAVGYAKGRLFAFTNAAGSATAYNVTTGGALPTALVVLPNGAFPTGSPVAEGPTAAYLAAQVGDKPVILRTAVEEDGTGMTVPAVAGQIPDGQVVRAIGSYLGSVVLVGTDDKVWTLDFADAAGNLATRGSVDAEGPVHAFEPQDRFVWFGGRDGGLTRLDLSTNTADDAAAFSPGTAADLDSGATGAVRSVVTFDGRRVFSVATQGVFAESDDLVTTGTVELGRIGFGIGDLKNALYADVRHAALAEGDSVVVEVAADDGPYQHAGTNAEPGTTHFTATLGQQLAETIRVRLTLSGNPTLRGVTVRAAPAPPIGELWQVPVMLFDKVTDLAGNEVRYDVLLEREVMRGFRDSQQALPVQIGAYSFTGLLDRMAEWRSEGMAYDDQGAWTGAWNGVQTLVIKKVD